MVARSISRSLVAAFAAWSCARTGAANARTPKKIVIIVLDAFSLRPSPFAVRRSPFAVRRAPLPKTALLTVSFVLVLVVVLVLDAFSRRPSPFAVRRSPFAVRRAPLPKTALLTVSFVLVLDAFSRRP